jgi:hypothetical protein
MENTFNEVIQLFEKLVLSIFCFEDIPGAKSKVGMCWEGVPHYSES